MHAHDEFELTLDRIKSICQQLVQQGWESAHLAMEELDGANLSSVKVSRVKTVTMAGVYDLRSNSMSADREHTLDLRRFAEAMEREGGEFVRFFSINLSNWHFLCALSDDLQALGSTAVRGSGEQPEGKAVGSVGTLPVEQVWNICQDLIHRGWPSANIAIQALSESPSNPVPYWLASPETLSSHYRSLAREASGLPNARPSRDMARLAEAMDSYASPAPYVRVFHLFDSYGWQFTCVLPMDLLQAVGSVAMKR